jgi:plasmid maintenance system antidote protein VapI
MIHRGEIVENAVRDSGVSISSLAKKLGKSRRHIYNLFQYHNLDWETIVQIGYIIKIDFSQIFPELKNQIQEKIPIKADNKQTEEIDYWKNKYISLLEEYNKLLKK